MGTAGHPTHAKETISSVYCQHYTYGFEAGQRRTPTVPTREQSKSGDIGDHSLSSVLPI
jgi:hypothetical protein